MFTLKSEARSAWARMAVDDNLQFYVNGNLVIEDHGPGSGPVPLMARNHSRKGPPSMRGIDCSGGSACHCSRSGAGRITGGPACVPQPNMPLVPTIQHALPR